MLYLRDQQKHEVKVTRWEKVADPQGRIVYRVWIE